MLFQMKLKDQIQHGFTSRLSIQHSTHIASSVAPLTWSPHTEPGQSTSTFSTQGKSQSQITISYGIIGLENETPKPQNFSSILG